MGSVCQAGRTPTNLEGMNRLPSAAAACAVAGLVLSGCAAAVSVEPAADAHNPECAAVMLRMPDEIDGHASRTTTSQGTDAWGDPSVAVLRCGVEPPGPSTDRCVSVNGVDWISTEETGTSWRFVSYGREPAVEVLVASDRIAGATVLSEISPSVSTIEQTRSCVAAEDLDEDGLPVETPDADGQPADGETADEETAAP